MNLLFQTAKPRRFSHTMVYCDERRERLQKLEAQARRELGMDAGIRPEDSQWADDGLRPRVKLGFRRSDLTRRRSVVPSLAIVALLATIVLACLLPWL